MLKFKRNCEYKFNSNECVFTIHFPQQLAICTKPCIDLLLEKDMICLKLFL